MLNNNKFNLYSISLISCFIVALIVFCIPIFPTYVIGDTVDGVTELVFSGYSWFHLSNAFLVLLSVVPLIVMLFSFIIQLIYIFKFDKFSKLQSLAFSFPFLFICIFCYMFAAYVAGGIFTAIFIYLSVVTNIEIYNRI